MSLQDHLAVMRNPFSTATTTPKVCDGKIGHSVGVREANATTVSSPAGVLHYMLYPGLGCGLQIIANIGGTATSTPPRLAQIQLNGDELTSESLVLNAQTGLKKSSAPDRWRVVSQGLRLTPINNSENNNGWFEAIRVPFAFDRASIENTLLLNGATPPVAVNAAVCIKNNFEGNILTSAAWAKHPSYVTGRLRNLEKHLFYLQPNNDREFVLNVDTPESQMDPNFDVVLIRIFASASNQDGTTLTVMHHQVQNFEFLFDAKNERSRYHSPSINYAAAVTRNDKFINRDPKASTIRNASGYAYSVR
jgi:hypothetical protein